MSAVSEWQLELDAAWLEEMGNVNEAVIYLTTEALAMLKERSPVGDPTLWKRPRRGYVGGQFRANWVVSVGQEDGTIIPFPGGDGESTLAQAIADIAAARDGKGYKVIYLQNNLPYAEALEAGHSTQAPSGVVAVTYADLQAMVEGITI